MTETQIDVDAAALEGLAIMPAHLIPLRDEFLNLKEQIDVLEARRDEIKEAFDTELRDNNLQGFILHGKVKSRRSDVTNTRLDARALKEKLPAIYAQYVKITKSVRLTIS